MSDITLSKGVRQNLLTLQNTAELLGKTQERLATGRKVNSALDNPINFFTASGLNARSNDLSRLLDSVGNAVQTVQAADKGISAITKLIESAQATARQALTSAAPAIIYENEIAGTVAIGADDEATVTGDAFANDAAVLAATGTLTIEGPDGNYSIDFGALSDLAGLNAELSAAATATGLTIGLVSDDLVITAADNTTTFEVTSAAGGVAADVYGPSNTDVDAFVDATLTVQVGADTATSITFTSRYDLLEQINAIDGITASFNGADQLEIVSTLADDITLGGAALGDLGLAAGPHEATESIAAPSETRTTAQSAFNELLVQITQLAGDASFNGVNLLNGDDLTVTFNEDGSSTLLINGVDFTAAGLGLTTQAGDAFQTNAGVNAAIAELDAATATLRSQAAAFGSNLSIVQARQDFTKNMINVLQIGADQLVLADSNEEGANMLALNTRQQLSTVALSLAAQADQNVLRLF
jgi:flagellin